MDRLSDCPDIKVSLEPSGNSSRLIVSLGSEISVVRYYVEMMDNNEIESLLRMKMFQKNNLIQLHYNLMSKTNLQQTKARRKMTYNNFIDFILGTIKALKDADEYLLPNTGIVFDPEYIYIDPRNYNPMFLYLPIYRKESDIQRLTDFLYELIKSDYIEDTTDGFLQRVITILERSQTLDSLCESVTKMRDGKPLDYRASAPMSAPIAMREQLSRPIAPQTYIKPVEQPIRQSVPVFPYTLKQTAQPDQVNKKLLNVSKPVVFFSIVQIIVVIMFITLVVLGVLFKPGTEDLNVLYIITFLFVVGGIDVVLYRGMFVDKTMRSGHEEGRKNSTDEPAKAKSALQPPPVPPTSIPALDNAEAFETEFLMDSDFPYLEYNVNGCTQRIILAKKIFAIGRLPEKVDYVCASSKVGRLHASFIQRNGNIYVRDNNTLNGTFINSGSRLTGNEDYRLFPKDKITLADVDFILYM